MLKKKLLILGISGLTGYKLANLSMPQYELFGTFNSRPLKIPDCTTFQLDLTNFSKTNHLLNEIHPDIIINATALHNVDYCEENENTAFNINTKLVELLSNYSEQNDTRLIHISTDYVFDGTKNTPYTEHDIAKPLNKYGESKLHGEELLKNTNAVVIRPSVVYGWTPLELTGKGSSSGKPINFALWLLTKLHNNESLKIVTDQYATATLSDSLAESILAISNSNKSGIYHVSGLSCESRFEFSKKFAKVFGYDENLIQPTDSSQFKQKARRPTYSCLDCSKFLDEFNMKLYSTEDSLKIMRAQVESEASYLLGK